VQQQEIINIVIVKLHPMEFDKVQKISLATLYFDFNDYKFRREIE